MSQMRVEDDPVDLFVIGGGINGCGIARDAAGRGLKVALAEMSDLASATSSPPARGPTRLAGTSNMCVPPCPDGAWGGRVAALGRSAVVGRA